MNRILIRIGRFLFSIHKKGIVRNLKNVSRIETISEAFLGLVRIRFCRRPFSILQEKDCVPKILYNMVDRFEGRFRQMRL